MDALRFNKILIIIVLIGSIISLIMSLFMANYHATCGWFAAVMMSCVAVGYGSW